MIKKFRIIAAGDAPCPLCESFDGMEFFMLEYTEGENAPPFHPNCRCEFEVFESDEIFDFENNSVITTEKIIGWDTTKIRISESEYAEIFKEYPDIIGGPPFGRPLKGTEIISWLKKNNVRLSDGKDYSAKEKIGWGLSKFDVDIVKEYETYIKTEENPMSYELFANICGPYWQADMKHHVSMKVQSCVENIANVAAIVLTLGSAAQSVDFSGINIKPPQIFTGGKVVAPGVGQINIPVSIDGSAIISGAIDFSQVNVKNLEQVVYAVSNLFGGGGSSGRGSNESQKPSLKTYKNNQANKQAEKHGFADAHEFKEFYVGRDLSKFDMKYDTSTKRIYLESKSGKIVATDYFHE